jgi:uridine kinase
MQQVGIADQVRNDGPEVLWFSRFQFRYNSNDQAHSHQKRKIHMTDYMDYIKQQVALHPSITPQDALKMCFQAAFGAEHLLTDLGKVEGYFVREYESCQPTDEPLYEMIAPEVCRVNLAAWKKLNLPPAWLFRLFVEAAASVCLPDSNARFFEYVNEWSEFVRKNGQALAFSFAEFEAAVAEYLTACGGKLQAVHHSPQYREAEKPAYRVISGVYVRLVPVLAALAGRTGGVIAIDGRAASGKSTLAAALKDVIGGEVIHMDDFFLPKALRTEARMKEAGGNIHYERFAEEVVSRLQDHKRNINQSAGCAAAASNPQPYETDDAYELSNNMTATCRAGSYLQPPGNLPPTSPTSFPPITHRIFNCQTMDYDGVRTIPPTPWLIVEGSYSQHPHFGDYADIRIFSTVDPQLQMKRITARNGKTMAQKFATTWIPMEEAYFTAYQIAEKSHTV